MGHESPLSHSLLNEFLLGLSFQSKERHNAAGARGNFWAALRRPPSSSSMCSPKKRWALTRTGRCMGRRRRAPPPLSSTTRSRYPWLRWRATPPTSTSRSVPTRSRTSKRQTASYARPQPVSPSSADGPLYPSCSPHRAPTLSWDRLFVMCGTALSSCSYPLSFSRHAPKILFLHSSSSADDGGELEQTRKARRGKEQDFTELSAPQGQPVL